MIVPPGTRRPLVTTQPIIIPAISSPRLYQTMWWPSRGQIRCSQSSSGPPSRPDCSPSPCRSQDADPTHRWNVKSANKKIFRIASNWWAASRGHKPLAEADVYSPLVFQWASYEFVFFILIIKDIMMTRVKRTMPMSRPMFLMHCIVLIQGLKVYGMQLDNHLESSALEIFPQEP